MPTILITGASSGIGQATALLFKKKGWHVLACMRNPQEAKQEIRQDALQKTQAEKTKNHIEYVQLDVTNEQSIQQVIAYIKKKQIRLDAILNNAGHGVFGAIEQVSFAEIEEQFAVNVFGPLRLCRAILPFFREQGGGTIVNVSSMAGRFAVPYYSVYSSTKFAVEGFSESFAYEVRPFGVRVKIIEPGGVNTGFFAHSKREEESQTNVNQQYGTAAQAMQNLYTEAGKKGIPPEAVAHTIYRAVHDSSNRLRYTVGPDAKINVFGQKILPHTWFMALVRKRLSQIIK